MDQVDFSRWAQNYERDIVANKDKYPFAGYFDIVDFLKGEIAKFPPPRKVLDLGVGTGFQLQLLLEDLPFDFIGLEFAERMLVEAAKRLDRAKLIQWDIAKSTFPPELKPATFDVILSSFTLHHFDLQKKLELIKSYFELLKPAGLFAIADISFNDPASRERVKLEAGRAWDAEEADNYFIVQDFVEAALKQGFEVSYAEMSFCAGVYLVKLKH